MGIFDWLFGSTTNSSSGSHDINPATGLPMTNGIGSVDVGGSPYGTNIHDDKFSSTNDLNGNGIDDMMESSFDSFDDPFNDF